MSRCKPCREIFPNIVFWTLMPWERQDGSTSTAASTSLLKSTIGTLPLPTLADARCAREQWKPSGRPLLKFKNHCLNTWLLGSPITQTLHSTWSSSTWLRQLSTFKSSNITRNSFRGHRSDAKLRGNQAERSRDSWGSAASVTSAPVTAFFFSLNGGVFLRI